MSWQRNNAHEELFMKILVTGTEGYLGALLAPILIERGHDVTGVDVGFYKSGYLYNARGNQPRTIVKDIRHLSLDDVKGHDAIVHMAELSNDPAGELAPNITYDINHKGSVRLAQLAKEAGVRRFIYMSSCSVYGVASGDASMTEESPVNPQTAYAVCKTLCERDIQPMADSTFSPVFFRNATAFGASPRQRFDLVVNNLCGLAWTTKEIKMTSDGTPWRPLVHGLDIAKAIALCSTPRSTRSTTRYLISVRMDKTIVFARSLRLSGRFSQVVASRSEAKAQIIEATA